MHVILTSNLYLPNIGGIENSLRSLSEVGDRRGDNILIVSSNIVDGGEYLSTNIETNGNVTILRYNTKIMSKIKFVSILYHIYSAVKCYASIQRKDQYTVIARYHWNVIFAKIAGFNNIRYLVPGVVKYQNSKGNTAKFNAFSFKLECVIQSFALKLSKVYIFSESMKEQLQSLNLKIDPTIVSPGIDQDRFKLAFIGNRENKISLLILSRLVPAKGIDLAIKSLSYLPKNFTLDIVGDGPFKFELERIVQELGLSNRIVFHKKTMKPEYFYNKSNIFLLPSLYEPFGQTILEASACGLPTVGFHKSIVDTSTNDILGDLGFYSNSLDEKSYADAIISASISLNENKKLRFELRNYILEKYSWVKLYNKLVG
ncbi:putative glycosyl transferase [Vibrio cholerae]|nr:putative glycosyltransferase [Vibrio cholerae]GIA50596.1 putative glycosyl transferase [Vibrio cholerae]